MLLNSPLNVETEKEFVSPYHKKFTEFQSVVQSDHKAQIDKFFETQEYNQNMAEEYTKGEEGIDYIYRKNPNIDPRLVNVAKMKADARA